MYTVGLDSAHQFLLIALIKDGQLVDSICEACPKQQSEFLVPKVDELLSKYNLEAKDIDNWVVTKGPGSYTGVRIAMTMVKVIGSLMNKNVYTLSTLQLYAGREDCYAIMDARAKRVYVGKYKDGKAEMADTIYSNEEMSKIIEQGATVVGDLHLFGKEDKYENLAQHFVDLQEYWEKVDNVDILAPTYLKSNEEYLK